VERGLGLLLPAHRAMFHYTNRVGFNAIRAQVVWLFRAATPPGEHPFGAYFTDLDERTPNLANRLRIPKEKTEHLFDFTDAGDLEPIRGSRGRHIFYSPGNYPVAPDRQRRPERSGTVGAGEE
jgi:hypothetical protein